MPPKLGQLQKEDYRKLREQLIGKVEILDRVKGLLLLPKIGFSVATSIFFEVTIDAIEKIVTRNFIELSTDGYELYKRSDLLELLNGQDVRLVSMNGKVIATMENGDKVIIPKSNARQSFVFYEIMSYQSFFSHKRDII